MKRFTLEIADEAWFAIEAQIRFIAVERQSPANAARWLNRLLKEITELELMPRLHTLDEDQTRELETKVYRLVFERTYLLFYTVNEAESRVTIVSFKHGARQDR